MAVRRSLAAVASVAGIASAVVPDLGLFASAPQSVDTAIYGAPSVGNAWATLLSSTNNVLGFNAFVLPPFSAGWTDPVDAVSLVVAGKNIAPSTTVWTPFSVERNGSATISSDIAVSVSSEIRMVFESSVVMIRANVGVPCANRNFCWSPVDLPPTRVAGDARQLVQRRSRRPARGGLPDADTPLPSGRPLPVLALPNRVQPVLLELVRVEGVAPLSARHLPRRRRRFPPQPLDFKDFGYAWTPASPPSQPAALLEVTDSLSSARGAYALAQLLPGLDPVDLSGSVAQWMPRVPAGGSLSLSFAAVYCITNTTGADAAAAASAVLGQVRRAYFCIGILFQQPSIPLCCSSPKRGRKLGATGRLDSRTPSHPGTLTTPASSLLYRSTRWTTKRRLLADCSRWNRSTTTVSSRCLVRAASAHARSPICVPRSCCAANERTNLPVQISGGPCTASVRAAADSDPSSLSSVRQNATRASKCSNTVPEDVRRVRLGGLARYLDRHAAAHDVPRECLPDIGGSGMSGRIIFTTGGALNTTVGSFYWDPSYSSTALTLLHPPFLRVGSIETVRMASRVINSSSSLAG